MLELEGMSDLVSVFFLRLVIAYYSNSFSYCEMTYIPEPGRKGNSRNCFLLDHERGLEVWGHFWFSFWNRGGGGGGKKMKTGK